MQILNVSILPIYLPSDQAQAPFGDPIGNATISSAAPAVVAVPGYNAPAVNDAVSLTPVAGATLPTGFTAGQTYYVVSPSGANFSLSATKGGAAINTTVSASSGNIEAHLLSHQTYGPYLPFKPGYTVIAENNTTGSTTLFGAADLNTTSFGNPLGPQAFSVIATIAAGSQALVVLNYDWIKVSPAIAGTGLTLQQN
jgi:hypothetical protein